MDEPAVAANEKARLASSAGGVTTRAPAEDDDDDDEEDDTEAIAAFGAEEGPAEDDAATLPFTAFFF